MRATSFDTFGFDGFRRSTPQGLRGNPAVDVALM
jgi:hypothetical protein